jgi:glycosyltransferase involved in cell wall biosynthesis
MKSKVLITTPDYPPARIGGISTFVLNLEKVLQSMGVSYEVFVWNKVTDLTQLDLSIFSTVINAHFHSLLKLNHGNMLTFVHGGELLAYSKNPIKRIIKSLLHKKILGSLNKSQTNIFVSEYSQKLYHNLSGRSDFSKNKVFHNCIDLGDSSFVPKDLTGEIRICCFVRDVPHKNVKGSLELYQNLKKAHSGKVSLTITSNIQTSDPDIICLPNASDDQREAILKESHLNLLLSLDHRHIGNIEGFGLTVLEAGKYGVPTLGLSNGGLVESIHHMKTGLLIDQVDDLYGILQSEYKMLSTNVFVHTHTSHGLNVMEKLVKAYL